METQQADVVVTGMGPGGEDVAGRLAEAGLDVVGVDRGLVGGECPYWGCIPSKMMIRAADLLAEGRRVPGMAGDAIVQPDWAPVAQRIRDEATDDWDDRVAVERFEGKGGRFLRGEGRIVASRRVAVGDRVVEARRGVVVATGTHATIPPIPGLSRVPYWTNRESIEAKELPSSLLVLGGGAVGAEPAQVFARFGVEVTVVEALERLVPGDEPEAGELLADVFARDGIAVHTRASVSEVRRDGARVTVELADGATLAAAQILVATGRRADLAAVGLGAVGVDESRRWVPVAITSGSPIVTDRHPWRPHRLRRVPICIDRACGRSATSPGRARSPMWPCTSRRSRWPTSWARTIRPPTTGPCPASRSRTPRSAPSASPRPRPASMVSTCGSAPPPCPRQHGAGSTRPATTA
jgi:pyruvate/2-oxoglutarate dehydrogenase complex dihydrolipoamide dehydrogenase (E3) component